MKKKQKVLSSELVVMTMDTQPLIQKEVARKAKISESALTEYKKGQPIKDEEIAERLAEALGLLTFDDGREARRMTLADLSLWGTKSDVSTAVKTVNKSGTSILESEDEYGYDIIDYLTMNAGRGKKHQKTMLARLLTDFGVKVSFKSFVNLPWYFDIEQDQKKTLKVLSMLLVPENISSFSRIFDVSPFLKSPNIDVAKSWFAAIAKTMLDNEGETEAVLGLRYRCNSKKEYVEAQPNEYEENLSLIHPLVNYVLRAALEDPNRYKDELKHILKAGIKHNEAQTELINRSGKRFSFDLVEKDLIFEGTATRDHKCQGNYLYLPPDFVKPIETDDEELASLMNDFSLTLVRAPFNNNEYDQYFWPSARRGSEVTSEIDEGSILEEAISFLEANHLPGVGKRTVVSEKGKAKERLILGSYTFATSFSDSAAREALGKALVQISSVVNENGYCLVPDIRPENVYLSKTEGIIFGSLSHAKWGYPDENLAHFLVVWVAPLRSSWFKPARLWDFIEEAVKCFASFHCDAEKVLASVVASLNEYAIQRKEANDLNGFSNVYASIGAFNFYHDQILKLISGKKEGQE